MIGRGNADKVDRLIIQRLAHVLHIPWLAALLLGDFRAALLSDITIGVADDEHFRVQLSAAPFAQMIVAAAVGANHTSAEFVIGATAGRNRLGREQPGSAAGGCGSGGGEQRIVQELTTR